MILYLSKNNLDSESQFGFRQRSTIIDALLKFTDDLKSNIDKNLYTCKLNFVDQSKGFDWFSPVILLRKPEEQWVPQGRIFGPLLFNVFVNDLDKQLEINCKIIQCADDTLNNFPNSSLIFKKTNLEFDLNRLLMLFRSHKFFLNED